MKTTLTICVLLLFCIVVGCKKETVIEPREPQNLIANSSFETNGNPAITGWQFRDSSIFQFAHQAPVGGGFYSVWLHTVRPSSFSMNSLITKLPLAMGNHRYRLSSWAKKTNMGGGSIRLFLGSGDIDTMIAYQTLTVADNLWSYYSTEITLANNSNDSVMVVLFGGYSPISYPEDSTFFDLCKFEILN